MKKVVVHDLWGLDVESIIAIAIAPPTRDRVVLASVRDVNNISWHEMITADVNTFHKSCWVTICTLS